MLKTNSRQAHWRRSNPLKYVAHLAVKPAVKAGELERKNCEVCCAADVDAHHDQYDEPLEVRWLCRRHHTRLHHYGELVSREALLTCPNAFGAPIRRGMRLVQALTLVGRSA